MSDRPGYYGRPALKPSTFEADRVAGYMAIAGVAGAAQVVATVARLFGGVRRAGVARNGRYLALAGAAAGPLLLVADLARPDRWYNMLRIFRRTSPMSAGSWILTGFGAFSGIAALGQLVADRRGRTPLARLGDAAQLPAAALGAGMASYTAALLSATSTPLWAAALRALAVRFAASATAGAGAALSLLDRLAGDGANCRWLDRIAFLATAVDTAASAAARRRARAEGATPPLDDPATRHDEVAAILVGQAVPLACYAANALRRRPSPTLSLVAAAGVLAGGAMHRAALIEAGKRSAQRPGEYFRFAADDRTARS